MENLDFNNWNSLRDFIESKRKVYINLMTHIDTLRVYAKKILKEESNSKLTKKNDLLKGSHHGTINR